MNAWIEIRHIRNLTTDSDVALPANVPSEVVEFNETSLVLQLPGTKIAIGVLIAVDCYLHLTVGSAIEFPIMGKVVSTEGPHAAKTGGGRTTVELRQFDTVLWRRFLTKVTEAQSRVDALFHTMKGEPRDG